MSFLTFPLRILSKKKLYEIVEYFLWWSWRVPVCFAHLFRAYTIAKPVRIGNLSCEMPQAFLTLSGQYPIFYDQNKNPI